MQHLAVILDGNKRWAEENNSELEQAYRRGAERAEEIIIKLSEKNIPFLTLYLFSQENWARPKAEIDLLMSLLEEGLIKLAKKITSHHLKITFLGDLNKLPQTLQELMREIVFTSRNEKGLQIRMALSYSSRSEIIKAGYEAANKAKSLEDYSKYFEEGLNPEAFPDPDFLIRTSGEKRLSNFLLWELAYTELYFTKTLWPDFDTACLDLALEDFNKRKRRFGQ
jgi:undecaprenyl diphosphate synthase